MTIKNTASTTDVNALIQRIDDLEISLSIAIEHGDSIEEELIQSNNNLNHEVSDKRRAENKLKLVLKTVTRQRDDLEISLNVAMQHGDAIEEHLFSVNQTLSSNLSEKEVLEKKLTSLVTSLNQQKEDLEILVETIASHGDEIHEEMHDQIDAIDLVSKTDPLTGIANRRAFDDALRREWLHSKRNQKPISLLMIDIDQFKQFNDTFGHIEGDNCLKKIATSISQWKRRSTDLIARYGGEEFIVLLSDCTLEKAHSVAENIRYQVEKLQLKNPDSTHKITTLSIGVASAINNNLMNENEFINIADKNLYSAKKQGRNQVISGEKNE